MNFTTKSDFVASLLLFSHKLEFFSFDCVALIFSLVLSFLSRKKKEQEDLKLPISQRNTNPKNRPLPYFRLQHKHFAFVVFVHNAFH
jgi:hypothetical protein